MIHETQAQAFFDFIEVLYELGPTLEHQCGLSPFSYIGACNKLKAILEDEVITTEGDQLLVDAILHRKTPDSRLSHLRSGNLADIAEDTLSFFDLLDEWRLSASRYYGHPRTFSRTFALNIFAQLLCDADEPVKTMQDHQKIQDESDAIPMRIMIRVNQDIARQRESAHHTTKSYNLDLKIQQHRHAMAAWDQENGIITSESTVHLDSYILTTIAKATNQLEN